MELNSFYPEEDQSFYYRKTLISVTRRISKNSSPLLKITIDLYKNNTEWT